MGIYNIVRIPLDYYRILGLPIQATAEQLKQAHRDRTLQLPRREYSEAAIEARKQLIDEAYNVLSQDGSRRDYDSKFLAKAYAIDTLPGNAPGEFGEVSPEAGEAALRSLATDAPTTDGYSPTIEIDEQQVVGALLILLELGEYELLIRLGRPYLSSGDRSLPRGSQAVVGNPQADTVLTLALACLELGREQWQQRQYELAAESLETGYELLMRESLFSGIRAEIQTELYKLRPYRILELLARPLDQTRERRQGLKLLKSMLEDRGGIEGTEDDLSGLSIDDFLRFIQQLRDYLTTSEQQELFEAEARRPSAVATYLTVYALLARGFARHQPALVRRAKQLLMRVGVQQDVHLEQAVCAMLLGQTEEASRALELSQEYEPLAFIREHSQGSPDLLPGLCLYAERWLRDEIFPHFRDLQEESATLKTYFADAQVQAYLETMPQERVMSDRPLMMTDWPKPTPTNGSPRTPATLSSPSPVAYSPTPAREPRQEPRQESWREPPATALTTPAVNPFSASNNGKQAPAPDAAEADDPLAIAERVSHLSPSGQLKGSLPDPEAQNTTPRTGDRRRPSAPTPPVATASAPTRSPQRRRAATSPHWGRLGMVAAVGLISIGVVGFLAMRAVSWVGQTMAGPKLEGDPLAIRLNEPVIDIPDAPTEVEQIGVEDIAQRAIENWLAAKRAALGPDYDADALKSVLTEPMLTQWLRRANAAKQENWYWEYDHSVEMESVEPNDPSADNLKATAKVTENARFFRLGVEEPGTSYDASLTMRYDLVRQNGEWLVQGANEVE